MGRPACKRAPTGLQRGSYRHRYSRAYSGVSMRLLIAPLAALLFLTTCTPMAGDGGGAIAGGPIASVDGDAPAGRADDAVQSEPLPAASPAEEAERPAAALPAVLTLPDQGPPVAPGDSAALAEILVAAEHAIRGPEHGPEVLGAAGHWQQVVYRRLAEEPERVEAVLAEVPAALHDVVRRNVYADARLLAMSTPVDPNRQARIRDLPPWRIVAPPPADELRAYYEEAEAATGVHWSYLAAINLVETRMGRISGVSSAGAQGPMQFMPATWAEWGQGDVHDHRDAIMAAGRYLRWGGMPGDVNGALFRYNRDMRYVDAIRTYAEQMQADPRAYYGYYHWQVYFNTRADNVWLAPGYEGSPR